MPPSEMKPTRLATVSVWPVSTRASTPPMNAVGRALRICRTIRTDGKSIISTTNMPTTDTHGQDGDQRRRPLLALELAAVLDEVARRQRRRARSTRCWMSATTLARSRPWVLQRMTMRRRAFSRLTALGPTPVADVGQLAQLDLAAVVGQVDPQPAQVGVVGAVGLLQPHEQVEAPLPFQHLRDRLRPCRAVCTNSAT